MLELVQRQTNLTDMLLYCSPDVRCQIYCLFINMTDISTCRQTRPLHARLNSSSQRPLNHCYSQLENVKMYKKVIFFSPAHFPRCSIPCSLGASTWSPPRGGRRRTRSRRQSCIWSRRYFRRSQSRCCNRCSCNCIACLSDDDPPLSHNCTNYHRSHWYNHALLLFGYQPILKKKNYNFISIALAMLF